MLAVSEDVVPLKVGYYTGVDDMFKGLHTRDVSEIGLYFDGDSWSLHPFLLSQVLVIIFRRNL